MSSGEQLSPKRRLVIGAFTVLMAAAGFAAGRTLLRPTERVVQPVQFNHQKHVKDVGLDCASCHEYFSTGQHSGLPSLDLCASCHSEALTKSSEEQVLLKLIPTKPQPEFHKLFRLPDHVRYSHSRHVTTGGLACENCHGGISETTAPPAVALRRITMETCMNCHVERKVKNDCTGCHR